MQVTLQESPGRTYPNVRLPVQGQLCCAFTPWQLLSRNGHDSAPCLGCHMCCHGAVGMCECKFSC